MTVPFHRLFDPFEKMDFNKSECFMCGAILDSDKTMEHVFPKWMQKKFNLWNKTITLLNGSTILYRQLTVPCCERCNGTYLSQLEKEIQQAVSGGYESFKNLDTIKIFQWISKLLYGLLYRQLFLLRNVKTRSHGKILTPQVIDEYRLLHFFLQSTRVPFEFPIGMPYSIHIVRTMSTPGSKFDFDYVDNIQWLTFAIRMGEIGVIACLQDNGVDAQAHHYFYNYIQGNTLHPVQFREVVARNNYSSSLLNRSPFYTIHANQGEGSSITVLCHPIAGQVYDLWEEEKYARILHFYVQPYCNISYEALYPGDRTVTFLFDDKGSFRKFSSEPYITYRPCSNGRSQFPTNKDFGNTIS